MAKLILGIVGEMSSGKGAIAKHVVENYNAGSHKFSQILRDILDRVYVEQSRENISALSLALRKNFGEDVLAKSMFHDAQNDEHDIVVIDGVRRLEDIVYLKELPEFKLIYIDANIEKRYERMVARGENVGDAEKTFAQFQREHELNADAYIQDLKNYASEIVDNNGTYADLYRQMDDIISENLK
jgi:dephospho-CoA kinase